MALRSQKGYGYGKTITVAEYIINKLGNYEEMIEEMINAYQIGIKSIQSI